MTDTIPIILAVEDYNGILSFFTQTDWSVNRAIKYSPSLSRAYEAIKAFEPVL
jgi:hypothetical protein